MVSLKGKIVLITGASSGIGAACAQLLAQAGADLILAARRLERVQELGTQLAQQYHIQTHVLGLDVCDRQAVDTTLNHLPDPWNRIDILVNNAGLSRGLSKLHEGNIDDWEEMLDTNVKGLLYVTRAVVPQMVERQSGHVVNIGSIAGRVAYPGGNVYCASKAAVRAISDGLKQDLIGTPVRVTEIEPGLVETEFSLVRFHGDCDRAEKVYQDLTPLTGEDIADLVLFSVTRPPHVNISEMLVVPVDQANATLVHRRR
ncbi:SDR family oxidoreductase [Laspinema olomoucense]|uniref:SDR family oxidoreductase n=1 Tax=Laspinema olomoucense TaxID=3231600 RepID=UPI0021BA909D|nr:MULTISPECIES: SDR family oxidoreductase [unclassified Laspinema]MCT7989173.1 SDR family oxidoreductase [Laspinema sp. D3a]MCT7993355.1 SDR family oxidoreductase [Laspinema sp. D3c]